MPAVRHRPRFLSKSASLPGVGGRSVLSSSDFTLIGGFAAPALVGGTYGSIGHRWVGSSLRFFSHDHSTSVYGPDLIEWQAPARNTWLTSGSYASYPLATVLHSWPDPQNGYYPANDIYTVHGGDWTGTVVSATATTVVFDGDPTTLRAATLQPVYVFGARAQVIVNSTGWDGVRTVTVAAWTNGTPQPGDVVWVGWSNIWPGVVTAADATHVTLDTDPLLPYAVGGNFYRYYLGVIGGPRAQTVLTTAFDLNLRQLSVASWPGGTPQAGDTLRLSTWQPSMIATGIGGSLGIFWDGAAQDLYTTHLGGYTSTSYSCLTRLHLDGSNSFTMSGPWYYLNMHGKCGATGAVLLSANFCSLAGIGNASIAVGLGGYNFSVTGSPWGPAFAAIAPPASGINAVDLNNNTATVSDVLVPTSPGFVDGIPTLAVTPLALYRSINKRCRRPNTAISRDVAQWNTSFNALGPGKKIASAAVNSGGTGYTVGDVLVDQQYYAAGHPPAQLTVTSISGGGGTGPATGLSVLVGGIYSTSTAQDYVFAGGTGTGITVTLTWGDDTKSIIQPDILPGAFPYITPGYYFQVGSQAQRAAAFYQSSQVGNSIITFANDWSPPVAPGTPYVVFQDYARGGSSTTMQLAAADTNTADGALTGYYFKIVVGTGAGLTGAVNNNNCKAGGYTGATRTMTGISPALSFTPDFTSGYVYSFPSFWDEGTGGPSGYQVWGSLGDGTSGDNSHASVYIEGASKWGFINFPHLTGGDGITTGLGSYYSSSVGSQYIQKWWLFFDPADLIAVARGTMDEDDPVPTSMYLYAAPTEVVAVPYLTSTAILGASAGVNPNTGLTEMYITVGGYYDGGYNQFLVFVYSVNC